MEKKNDAIRKELIGEINNIKNIKKEIEELKNYGESSEEKQVKLEEKPKGTKNIRREKSNFKSEKNEKNLENKVDVENKEKTVVRHIKVVAQSDKKPHIERENAKKENKMFVIPMGGLEEVGKNNTIIQYKDELVIIDSGVMFPDENLPGIDLVIPDFTYIENNKEKVKALLVTHGHEDHIGSIPYLYQKIDKTIPIYGGKLTNGLVKSKFEGLNMMRNLPKMKEVKGREKLKIGKYFTVEFIRVTHSIADAFAIAVTTPAGTVLTTGDFKIDLTPVDGKGVDFTRLSEIGEKGVDLLLSDSTNSEVEGFTPSEKSVGEAIKTEFLKAKGRIIIASFASHVHRLQQIVDVAYSQGRKIAIDGRSMVRVFEIAGELGYLKVPKDLIIPLTDVDKLPKNKCVVLCTGTQGEPLAALSRIAKGMHKHIKVSKGDTVIISATPIPGNEKAVSSNLNYLAKENVNVVFKKIAGIHVSGHGSKEEQKLLLSIVNPKNFMPIHGEYRMLQAHKKSAMEVGMREENIIIALNGQRVEVSKIKAGINGKVASGVTLIDGLGIGDIGNSVIKERQQLSQDGVVIINVIVNKESGKVVSGPTIETKGFIYGKDTGDIISEGIEILKKTVSKYDSVGTKEINYLKNNLKDASAKFFYGKIKRNPIVIPIIIEI